MAQDNEAFTEARRCDMSAATDRNKRAMANGAAVHKPVAQPRNQAVPLKKKLRKAGLKPGRAS